MSDIRKWEVNVGENVIRVTEQGELFVNDKLQDKSYGVTTCERLEGRLPDGRIVRTVIGAEGFGFKLHCSIFVDFECVLQD